MLSCSQVRVITRETRINRLVTEIESGTLFVPDIHAEWSIGAQSRYIESILIRLPLYPIVVDATGEQLTIVDGLQRCLALKSFILDNSLKLTDFEFLDFFEGKGFKDLERRHQRQIEETSLTLFLIEAGTLSPEKSCIIKRYIS